MDTMPRETENAAARDETGSFYDLAADASRRDGRRLRRAIAVAAAAHLTLFAVDLPDRSAEALEPEPPPRVYVIEQVRFRPPQPPPPEPPPQPPTRPIPVPDPTPDDPEPVRTYEEPAPPDLVLPPIDAVVIPDAPPPLPEPDLPLPVGGEVTRPVKISGPQPVYTEMARRARIQGSVIVRATIDREGRVVDLEVIKPMPLGLSESVLTALRASRFSPGTLRGKPVPVLYDLTVDFRLQ